MSAPTAALLAPATDARAVLANPSALLPDVMSAVEALEAAHDGVRSAHVGLSSGATVDLLGLYLRRHALLAGVKLTVSQGNFDDPLGDLTRFAEAGVDHLVLQPFLDTLAPAFEARAATLSDEELAAFEAELRGRWRLVLQGASGVRAVFLCSLHRMGPALAGGDRVDAVVEQLNRTLRDEAASFSNVRWLDIGAMIGALGRKSALDFRFYLRNSAPYAAPLLDEWARQVAKVSRGYGTRYHKALVLDCDNTLWGGIVGEDLASGIKISPHSYPGNVFHRAQAEFLALQQQGVLLCLCSKNEPADVDAVLERHPEMVLRPAHIVAARVNWSDKVENLRSLAAELNIGLDSLVFVDDSDFECEAIRAQLPEVAVFQVPKSPPEYLAVVAEIRDLFLAGGATGEGAGKTEQYRLRTQAAQHAQAFANQADYLASLGLTVTLSRNDPARAPRIAELSQKSNQFNLTTVRYTPAEVEALMRHPDAAVYGVEVADRFGAHGLTGVAVLRYAGDTATVESLFMSCRVLGRGVEFAFWPHIIAEAAARGCRRLRADYRPTPKNLQTADFYDRLGLSPASEADGVKAYQTALADIRIPASPSIKVLHD